MRQANGTAYAAYRTGYSVVQVKALVTVHRTMAERARRALDQQGKQNAPHPLVISAEAALRGGKQPPPPKRQPARRHQTQDHGGTQTYGC
jgi:hypothetical protein